ncbi:MAG: transcription termination factor NusA [Oscillospiraceae bacterium]
MDNEIFESLEMLSQENGIPMEMLIDKIKQGVLKAVKREYPDCEEFARIDVDPDKRIFDVIFMRNVVDDEPTYINEINIDEARTIEPNCMVGDVIPYKMPTARFGRVAAQNAKQSIRHDIKEFEKNKLIAQFEGKENDIVSATVLRIEPNTGNATVLIDKNEIYFFKNEMIPGETLNVGDIVKVYVVGIFNRDKKPSVKISRTHKEFVKRLFELEIPEIYDGTVEINAISREAGARTKIAVSSKDPNVDPVGACIGPKRSRISSIVNELNGEKIDIIVYDEDPAVFIAKALAPAAVLKVEIGEGEEKTCRVVVPNNQLSLAIGNKGQNAKLAARLTGYKIDINPEIAPPAEENEEEPAESTAEEAPAEAEENVQI